ncbi:hypothetical protein DB88DRAFT_521248 [Papiliotrema laurentii]|uniref:Myb-like domain-containing protein n=1 Tax=Papiliotrema laurentii TaxID=5418 RepID=A0AAD9FU58_PAPLA|nr:hypothetical protein DB88DRAFT_521248 [Papiliotrema laurentii]
MAGALSFNLATLSAAIPLATGKDPHYRLVVVKHATRALPHHLSQGKVGQTVTFIFRSPPFFIPNHLEPSSAMPASKPAPSTPKRPQPYPKAEPIALDESSSIDGLTTPNSKPSKQESPSKSPGKPWTGEELQAIFRFTLKNGSPKGDSWWAGAVPGRTGSQCRNAWRFRVLPLIEAALAAGGK